MSSIPPVRIAIVGAGPGGLTLARILQLSDIHATVDIYERDLSATYRQQGGSLDLHPESGQVAMKAAQLFDEFRKYARYEGEGMRILDKDAKVWLSVDGPLGPPPGEGEYGGRPEIDRTQLRDILLDSLKPSTIHWGHNLQSVIPVVTEGVNEYKLTFANEVQVIADVVIGADGAWSRVRTAIIPDKPVYTGVSFIDITIRNPPSTVSDLVGPGLLGIFAGSRSIIAQRNAKDIIRVYAALRESPDYLDERPELGQSLSSIEAEFKGWHTSLLDLIRAADQNSIIPRKIYATPIPLPYPPSNKAGSERQPSLSGITLLGDAAHTMSPFAGEGVNLAMADAADLAQSIVGALQPTPDLSDVEARVEFQQLISHALRIFDSKMEARASVKAEESARNLELAMAEDAPAGFVERLKAFRLADK